jgi:hypothetical protein
MEEAAGLSEIVNGDDVRMVQGGQGAGFPGESSGERLVTGERFGKNLERDKAIELRLPGLEDATHPALADQFEDLQLREGGRHRLNRRSRWPAETASLSGVGRCRRPQQQAPGTKALGRVGWQAGGTGRTPGRRGFAHTSNS